MATERYSDDIDVRALLKSLIARKRSISIAMLVSAVLSLIITLIVPQKFESTGFYTFPPVTTPRYKAYSGLLENVNMLNAFIEANHSEDSWIVSNTIFKESYSPIFSYGENPQNLLKENSVIGVNISTHGNSPESAQLRANTLGLYISTSIINENMWYYYSRLREKVEEGNDEYVKNIIGAKEAIEQLQEREKFILNDLKDLYNSDDEYDRMVMHVDAETEKYLPPHQQLIATKLNINNAKIRIANFEHAIKVNEFTCEFLDRVNPYFADKNQFIIDTHLLKKVLNERKDFLESIKNSEFTVEVTFAINEKLNGLVSLRDFYFRFISGPVLPTEPGKPSRSKVALLMFMISMAGFIGIDVFRSWWRNG